MKKSFITEDGKTVININMSEGEEELVMEKEKKVTEFYYFRESALQSIVADVVTFGILFSGFLVNALLLGGKWYIHIFFMIVFFIAASAKANKRARRFTNLKEFQDYVKNLK